MGTVKFSETLERRAFRAGNDEPAWLRADGPTVVGELVSQNLAILGGEIWWVPPSAPGPHPLIPQRRGPDAFYGWEVTREAAEQWTDYVRRSASAALELINKWPNPDDLPAGLSGDFYYNLTWASEAEFSQLGAPLPPAPLRARGLG